MNISSTQERFAPAMAWAEIDLKAVEHNFSAIKKAAGQQVKVLCVIKADAYGHGNIPIAKLLERRGVDMLGISDLHEGIALRKAGINVPILMVENTLVEHAKYLAENKITPIICTDELARALNALGAKQHRKIPVHIKVDTGMGRLGVAVQDALFFARSISDLPWLKIEGICTHFPLSDKDRLFTLRQQKEFLSIVRDIQKNTSIHFEHIHAANSMGIAVYPLKGFTMARAGLILYGLYPASNVRARISLRPVMRVKSRVTFVKKVAKGQGISYGHRFIAPQAMRIATIAIGYNDGYLRTFSNKTDVLIHGQRCPVLGTVTMDQIMADISHVARVKIGDEVCLLGRQGENEICADELARIAGTISYEITCLLGSRAAKLLKPSKRR